MSESILKKFLDFFSLTSSNQSGSRNRENTKRQKQRQNGRVLVVKLIKSKASSFEHLRNSQRGKIVGKSSWIFPRWPFCSSSFTALVGPARHLNRAPEAGEGFNLERQEFLGDSFLKFAVGLIQLECSRGESITGPPNWSVMYSKWLFGNCLCRF